MACLINSAQATGNTIVGSEQNPEMVGHVYAKQHRRDALTLRVLAWLVLALAGYAVAVAVAG